MAEALLPKIKERFGESLVAIAVRGSTAKKTDGPYSDLELFAFITSMTNGERYGKLRKIVDGLLIEIIWVTPENYIREVKEISRAWFGSGADYLFPLYNKEKIDELNAFVPIDAEKKCLDQAAALWDHVQEAATKVLNASEAKNSSGMPLVMGDLFSNLLKMVSFFNAKPYTTFAQLIVESKQMSYRPEGFDELTNLVVDGKYTEFVNISTLVLSVMTEFEERLLGHGYTLQHSSFEF